MRKVAEYVPERVRPVAVTGLLGKPLPVAPSSLSLGQYTASDTPAGLLGAFSLLRDSCRTGCINLQAVAEFAGANGLRFCLGLGFASLTLSLTDAAGMHYLTFVAYHCNG